MSLIRVTKEFHFEMAHALWNYDGACRNIHGHSYKLFVTVVGKPLVDEDHTKFGMVIDFKDLKSIVNRSIIDVYDHSLLLYHKTKQSALDAVLDLYEKVIVVDFQPTCENMILHFAITLKQHLPENTELHSLRLFETATSYAEWFASDNN